MCLRGRRYLTSLRGSLGFPWRSPYVAVPAPLAVPPRLFPAVCSVFAYSPDDSSNFPAVLLLGMTSGVSGLSRNEFLGIPACSLLLSLVLSQIVRRYRGFAFLCGRFLRPPVSLRGPSCAPPASRGFPSDQSACPFGSVLRSLAFSLFAMAVLGLLWIVVGLRCLLTSVRAISIFSVFSPLLFTRWFPASCA